MELNKAKVFLLFLMVINIMVNGKMTNKMA